MRLRHAATALGLLAPACAPTAPHRGRTAPTTAAPAPQPGTPDSRPDDVEPAPASSVPAPTTTAYVVTVPTDPPTTTTVRPRPLPTTTLPEAETDEDEWTARDATTARVSWYGAESGAYTANGDRYDPSGLTFAHLSMPFGSRVKFCGPLGCVVATCTDRGPSPWTGKTFDLSRGAFATIAPLSAGVITATWERVG